MSYFRVWAPAAKTVSLVVSDTVHQMAGAPDGWWTVEVPSARHGTDYAYLLDDGEQELPDPRSAWQPHGVHGRSRLVDHARFPWTDVHWRGVPLAGSVLYELHVGTFTPQGTFDAAIERLDHLADLGIDIVELLPVNAYPGRHGWGYDGVGLFAVHEPYGGPEGLKRFVDAAHARGLGVIMDVVYNHLGPDGNYLGRFGPYFTDRYSTPWGPAVNLDTPGSDEVRAFIIDSALAWLRDYHCDGLRLDAVHAFVDNRARHLLEEISDAVHRLGTQQRRPLFAVAESDLNDPRMITAPEAGGHGLDGQWADDIHHALWSTLSGERQGYYGDFGSFETLSKALSSAFVHDGEYSTFRGRAHGRPVPRRTPAYRFVTFLQNHDQIGNRATGDRASATLSDGRLRIGAALLLTAPFTPMLFMGEEWGATTPWQYFTDHTDPGLAEAVRTGRRGEFAAHGWGPQDVPDPQDPATFERSRLDWVERDQPGPASMLDWHRRLIALRRRLPQLSDPALDSVRCSYDERANWFVLRRLSRDGDVAVVCNLGTERQSVPVDGVPFDAPAASRPGFTYMPGRVELAGESVVVVRLLPTA
ncbi:maltooligosyltrehalose trehalohydrolase [Parafrankia irregularis]|uniref:Malto-oligosyltrehalose trehalohydrolase n=1 Tax=Parafrankia irregularis TaxID=795642 RepID=A0A0S4QLV5_9ACTN|nr:MULTISPECIES: malto-oligosyltrehalose trehalohydrolase [Parafrankia]MBE3202030.1 malto-oligosyltrehalose trehalohydrolase [Parafrankia sp. CH37]CUU55804.1 maltooligosyltrehalose trehalohydrolase [Parafrankia irregularis]